MNGEIDFEALGERASMCPRFRWLAGMLELGTDARCIEGDDGEGLVRWTRRGGLTDYESVDEDSLPDLRDACTLGGLLALWMEAWPAESDDRARRVAEIQDAISDHDTSKLAEALVSALEAAP